MYANPYLLTFAVITEQLRRRENDFRGVCKFGDALKTEACCELVLFAQPGWRSENVSRGFLSEAVSRTVLMDCVVILQYLVRGMCSQEGNV